MKKQYKSSISKNHKKKKKKKIKKHLGKKDKEYS